MNRVEGTHIVKLSADAKRALANGAMQVEVNAQIVLAMCEEIGTHRNNEQRARLEAAAKDGPAATPPAWEVYADHTLRLAVPGGFLYSHLEQVQNKSGEPYVRIPGGVVFAPTVEVGLRLNPAQREALVAMLKNRTEARPNVAVLLTEAEAEQTKMHPELFLQRLREVLALVEGGA